MNDSIRYKLTLAYDGTDFAGWQKQEPPDPDASPDPVTGERPRIKLRTVQEVVEQAVRETVREPVTLTGASRTDAGVHARGQVASFMTTPDPARGVGWPLDRGTDALVQALNSRLPDDVLCLMAEPVALEFDPISGARSKEYTYTIQSGHTRPLFDRRTVYHCYHELDVARMQEAARHLVGEHDFAAMAQASHGRKTTVRTIFACDVEDEGERSFPGETARIVRIRVSGSGFLYNMVRIIAGTLVEVGRGKMEPDAIPGVLESGDRVNAGPTLAPEGLRLEWIRYDTDDSDLHT
ncbi:MAG: tRNA pseudouridine synthase A [Planctomycetota bacterium]